MTFLFRSVFHPWLKNSLNVRQEKVAWPYQARSHDPEFLDADITRTGASAGCRAYTVTFTDQGYDSANSGIQAIPDINPISNAITTTTTGS